MKYKAIIVFILVFVSTNVYSVQKWRTVLGKWENLSSETNSPVPDILRRSIALQLSQLSNFEIILAPDWTPAIKNWADAQDICRENRADIIIYGNCYVSGDKIAVFVEVFDGLESRPRLRQNYEAKIDLDIFDTIDSMVRDMIVKIRETLPELSYEEEVRIEEIRRSLYEQETVTTKRMFCASIGADYLNIDNHTSRISEYYTNNYDGTTGNLRFLIGFTYRYEFLRISLELSQLMGIPSWRWCSDFGMQSSTIENLSPSYLMLNLTCYLPFWNERLGVGIGIQTLNFIIKNTNSTLEDWMIGGSDQYSLKGMPFLSVLSLNVLFRVSERLEIMLVVNPFPHYETETGNWKPEENIFDYYEYSDGFLQPIALRASYFPFRNKLAPLGFEVRLLYYSYEFTQYRSEGVAISEDYFLDNLDEFIENTADGTCYSLYLGLIYKLDLM